MNDKPESLAAILAEMRDPCAPRAPSLPALADEVEAAVGRMRREYERLHECFWNIDSIQSIVRQMLDERDDLRDKNPQASEVAAHFAQLLTKAATPAPGNVAALREALKKIDADTDLLDVSEDVAPKLHPSHSFVAIQIRKTVRAALAAPARNADRPECKTLPDAIRFGHFECGHREWWVATMTSADWHDFADWLLAPAEGKEADHA